MSAYQKFLCTHPTPTPSPSYHTNGANTTPWEEKQLHPGTNPGVPGVGVDVGGGEGEGGVVRTR